MELDIVRFLQYFLFCDQLLLLSHVMVVPFVRSLAGFRLLVPIFSIWQLLMWYLLVSRVLYFLVMCGDVCVFIHINTK